MHIETVFTSFGYIGSGLIGVMMIPQAYWTVKTKETKDISFLFIAMNMLAVGFMLPYSVYFELYPVLAGNISVGICNFLIMFQIIQNFRKKKLSESKTDTSMA